MTMFFDKQIELVSAIQIYAFVSNRNDYLPLKADAAQIEFMTQTLFVS